MKIPTIAIALNCFLILSVIAVAAVACKENIEMRRKTSAMSTALAQYDRFFVKTDARESLRVIDGKTGKEFALHPEEPGPLMLSDIAEAATICVGK